MKIQLRSSISLLHKALLFLMFLLFQNTLIVALKTVSNCTFTLSDIPIPEESLIVGDVRKNPICQSTSFDSTRPPDLFNPNGLRMWSKEEDSMSISTDPEVKGAYVKALLKDQFSFNCYWRIARPFLNKRMDTLSDEEKKTFPRIPIHFHYIQIPKTGSTTIKDLVGAQRPLSSDDHWLPPYTLASVRHPITRFISGLGTIRKRFHVTCVKPPPKKKKKKNIEQNSNEKKIEVKVEKVKEEFRDDKFCVRLENILFPQKTKLRNLNITITSEEQTLLNLLDFLLDYGGSYPYLDAFSTAFGLRHYLPHVYSQMYFVNLYPLIENYNFETTPANHSDVDFMIREEGLQEGIAQLITDFPMSKEIISNAVKIPLQNPHEGGTARAHNKPFSCSFAWKLHEYFIQDFFCLNYTLPSQCLKEECKI